MLSNIIQSLLIIAMSNVATDDLHLRRQSADLRMTITHRSQLWQPALPIGQNRKCGLVYSWVIGLNILKNSTISTRPLREGKDKAECKPSICDELILNILEATGLTGTTTSPRCRSK